MTKTGVLSRLALVFSVLAGVSYIASWWLPLAPAASTLWKGAGVGFLVIYAALRARDADGWLICAVLGFGMLGDVLLETSGLAVGAMAFLVGHVVAIGLYLRNRRPALTRSQGLLAIVLPPAVVAISFALPTDRTLAPGVALYALGLSTMAACAWISRFPRLKTGLGALMFVVSDLLIFARVGPLQGLPGIGVAIWGLYFVGQFLICIGVVTTLAKAREQPA